MSPAELCQSKIHNLGDAITGDHNVGRLDIPVDDAFGMGFFQSFRHLQGDIHRFGRRQRSAFDAAFQRLLVVIGHHDEQLPILGLAKFVDGANIGMVKRRSRARLLNETLFGLGVARQLRRQKLNGDVALQFGVFRFVDDAHAAFAELGADLVMGDNMSDHVLCFPARRDTQKGFLTWKPAGSVTGIFQTNV